jgi:hypothetical protein
MTEENEIRKRIYIISDANIQLTRSKIQMVLKVVANMMLKAKGEK